MSQKIELRATANSESPNEPVRRVDIVSTESKVCMMPYAEGRFVHYADYQKLSNRMCALEKDYDEMDSGYAAQAERIAQLTEDNDHFRDRIDVLIEQRDTAQSELGAARNGAEQLCDVLAETIRLLEQHGDIQGYGFARPANPHDFCPDAESCTQEEIANHKAACEAYDAGNYRDDYGDGWITPDVHITKAPWGIGCYTMRDADIEKAIIKARAALDAARTQDAGKGKAE